MIKSIGEMGLDGADDANVPVDVWLDKIDEDDDDYDPMHKCPACGLGVDPDDTTHFPVASEYEPYMAASALDADDTLDSQGGTTYNPPLTVCPGSSQDPIEIKPTWRLKAGNYMPRKAMVAETSYEYVGDNREELAALIEKYIKPLYEIAITQLNNIVSGAGKCLYYWHIDTDQDDDEDDEEE